ncbi:MAG: S8 family serine peptidase, partial [Actinomycetota bacterium]|nr:S8 family serine peptidase [Actinomycetota bacterium]
MTARASKLWTGAIVALLLATSVTAATVPRASAAEDVVTVPASDGSESEYLVNLSDDDARAAGLDVIRSIGFGWTLARSRPGTAIERSEELDELSTTVRVEPDTAYELFAEPLFGEQWALENTGQTGGTPDADIDAPQAWERTIGQAGVVIAVVDTGVDLDHPDLTSRLWTNEGEIPGNGIDDDANGYIDDVHGWDTYSHDGDPNDEAWHGTAVAGVAAAAANGVGISGVAPGATIMVVRACQTSCPTSAIVEGIAYALDNGARIVNLSLGSHTANDALEDAVNAAGAAGAVVVAASGNSGTDNDAWPIYPAGYPGNHIIAVAATDHNDELAASSGWASNYGSSSVDLGAPGVSIRTTSPGGWTDESGTSFAAPHVAGAAALIRSLRPESTPESVSELLFLSVDTLPGLTNKVATGGRLNAGGAVDLASAPVAIIAASPTAATIPFNVSFDGTGSYDPQGSIVLHEWRFPGGESADGATAVWIPPGPGLHVVELVVTDDEGFEDSSTISIHANAAPTAAASGSPTLGWAPLSVTVSGDGSSDGDGSIVAWDWVAGASTATGANTTLDVGEVGEQTVVLTVTDDFGAASSDQFAVLVGFDFVDTRSSIFRLDIAWMSALGITKGCNPPTNDRYCPTNAVTREQMAAFLNRALHLPPTTTDYFTDD